MLDELNQGTLTKGEMLSTVDLLVLTTLDQLLLTLKAFFYKTSYPNSVVNRTEHSLQFVIPGLTLITENNFFSSSKIILALDKMTR